MKIWRTLSLSLICFGPDQTERESGGWVWDGPPAGRAYVRLPALSGNGIDAERAQLHSNYHSNVDRVPYPTYPSSGRMRNVSICLFICLLCPLCIVSFCSVLFCPVNAFVFCFLFCFAVCASYTYVLCMLQLRFVLFTICKSGLPLTGYSCGSI